MSTRLATAPTDTCKHFGNRRAEADGRASMRPYGTKKELMQVHMHPSDRCRDDHHQFSLNLGRSRPSALIDQSDRNPRPRLLHLPRPSPAQGADRPSRVRYGSHQDRHLVMPSSPIRHPSDARPFWLALGRNSPADCSLTNRPAVTPPTLSGNARCARSARRSHPSSAVARLGRAL
jgi:hypothetical protein